MLRRFIVLLALTAPATCLAQQKVSPKLSLQPASVFADHMVFQRESDAPVWGTARPGSSVTVAPSWSDKTFTATADKDGKWQTKVKTPKAGGPFHVQIKSGSQSRVLKDVLIGEVWICSGQSNMQWKMRGFGLDHWKEDVAKAKYPNIRLCDVQQRLALKPQESAVIKWTACTPRTAINFSAVGYFFGAKLHQELDVPIGLISTNWGGSSAEAWVSPKTLKQKFPEFNQTSAGYVKHLETGDGLYSRGGKKAPQGLNQRSPALLHNSMIRPLIPFAFRGVIWYQGESNIKKPMQYRKLFPAMIRDWRTDWNAGDFPFYFVQIAPFAYKREPYSAAYLREAQLMTLSEPNTGMAVTMDVGNATNIHPKQKKPVADRLARLAMARDYGKPVVDSGPMYESFKVQDGSIRLSFSTVGGGLTTRDGKPLTHFTIAADDQKFVAAQAKIDGHTVVVSAESVPNPVAVRYGWGSADMPNLSNKEGLPSSSFRTDDWPIK